MKRLAIVSSYDEECGAAFYSSRLKKHLEAAGYAVDVKRLPVSLLRLNTPISIRVKGDEAIERIAREIEDYDAVLLQFEPGLYGSRPRSSYRRVERLLRAAKLAVVTVHGFHRGAGSRSWLGAARATVTGQFREAFSELRANGDLMKRVTRFWQYVGSARHVKVLTFCKADQTLLERYFSLTQVTNYPITYYDREEVEQIKSSVDREQFLRQYGLDPRKKYFGVFGFLSPYKGHLTAIKALDFLPDDWNLAIVGGEHPQAIEAERDIGGYVRQLLAFALEGDREANGNGTASTFPMRNSPITNVMMTGDMDRIQLKQDILKMSEFKHFLPTKPLAERVKFLGQVSDDDMPRFYSALDYAVHPYMKTKSGQSGSGPATLAIEFGIPSLFSNVPVFREMNQYFKDSMAFFNVGNFVELSSALRRDISKDPQLHANREAALGVYNPASMVDAYRRCLEL